MRLRTIKKDLSKIDSDRYWDLVRRTLGDIFHRNPNDASPLEHEVRTSPPEEQVLFYHLEPLSTAADIADREPTPQQIERYKALRANVYKLP